MGSAAVLEHSVRPVFLAVLLTASVVGAILGAVGAAANRVKTSDEFLLWVFGGAIGCVLAVFVWTGTAQVCGGCSGAT